MTVYTGGSLVRRPGVPASARWGPAIVTLLVIGCGGGERSYLDRRADFSSRLTQVDTAVAATKQGLAQAGLLRGEPPALPAWDVGWGKWEETVYPSGEWDLAAYTFVPMDPSDRRPAFVYLHPGAFPQTYIPLDVLDDTRAIIEAGFVVAVPTFRGEGGNPGSHEFWLGEVDDAAAVVRWLVEQPYVDPDHTYAIGWSYGGAVAALLSLLPDVPVRHSASFGGLVTGEWFDLWPKPFDPFDPVEKEMRMLVGNIRWMQHRHYAYVGSADASSVAAVDAVRREAGDAPTLLEIIAIPGEHAPPAARTAIGLYLQRVREEIGRGE